MSQVTIQMFGAIILCGTLASVIPALAQDRPADAILKLIDAIKLPQPDLSREKDKAYIQEFLKRRSKIRIRRAELIGELYLIDPENPKLVALLPVRWRALSGRGAGPDVNVGVDARDVSDELNEVLARSKSDDLKTEAAYIKAQIASDPSDRIGSAKDKDAKARAVDEFIAFAPEDERGAQLLYIRSHAFEDDVVRRKAVYQRLVEKFPESRWAKVARGLLSRLDASGKAFDLSFNDAIGGGRVSIQGLRGKIVVVDFWATWCGPCVAEMPRMKNLYAKYHEKGVEFIGVNLDSSRDGFGPDKLKTFAAKNEIPWPQYNEGESGFSEKWGIDTIPAVFLVDQMGKLVSVDAGGNLETLILELMNRKAPTDDGARGR